MGDPYCSTGTASSSSGQAVIVTHPNLTDITVDVDRSHRASSPLSKANLFATSTLSDSDCQGGDWVYGTATLCSVEACYPGAEAFLGGRVRFDCCEIGCTSEEAFLEYGQLSAINSPEISSPAIRGLGCLIVSSSTRDRHWLIRSEPEEFISLVDWLDGVRTQYGQSPKLYRIIIEICIQIIHCIKRLQDKGISIASCRPDKFAISTSSHHVTLVNTNDLYLSSSFEPLFPGHHVRSAPLPLDDTYISQNLRFLSPETAASRNLSKSNLVYSMGALLYAAVIGKRVDKEEESGRDNIRKKRGESEGTGEEATDGSADEESQNPMNNGADILSDVHQHVTTTPIDPINLTSPPITQSLNDVIMLCLAKDVERRYIDPTSLLYDLKLCLSADHIEAGRVDLLARLRLPAVPLHSQDTLSAIDNALDKGSHINIWGSSGSGKSYTAYAKLDNHMARPLSSFSQIFENLLDQIFADPNQEPKAWIVRIQQTLQTQYPLFVALLSKDYRSIFSQDDDPGQTIVDWDNLLAGFALWSRRLLQLFATSRKPLLLMIDDIQWLRKEEVDLWRAIFDGKDPLEYVRCISMYRIDKAGEPSTDALLSKSAVQAQILPFSLDGVTTYLETCCQGRLADSCDLASVLLKQTGGNPLFVRARVSEIYTLGHLWFDQSAERWIYNNSPADIVETDNDISAYLDEVLRSLDMQAQRMLTHLSCLPSSGFDIDLLAELLGVESSEIVATIESIDSMDIVQLKDRTVKFTHDQKQANQAIIAQKLRQSQPDAKLISLVMEAAERAALSAGFATAHGYLQTTETYLRSYDDQEVEYHDMYFRFLGYSADVCGALKMTVERTQWLDEMQLQCRSLEDELVWATVRVKQLSGEFKNAEAADVAFAMIAKCGYNMKDPITPMSTSDIDVETVWAGWKDDADYPKSNAAALIDLLSFAGAAIFVSRSELLPEFANLALKIVLEFPYIHAGAGHLFGLYCMADPVNIPLHRKLIELAWRTTSARPLSPHAGTGLGVCGGLAHGWTPLVNVSAKFMPALEHASTYGLSAMYAYIMMLDLSARNFAPSPIDKDTVLYRYRQFPSDASTPIRSIVHICLQYAENAKVMVETQVPWIMEGKIFGPGEIVHYVASPLHQFMWHISHLRLAVFYGAPLPVLKGILDDLQTWDRQVPGLSPSLEYVFLESVVRSRDGSQLRDHIDRLRACQTPDHISRVRVLDAIALLHTGEVMDQVDAILDQLDQTRQYELAGLLGMYTGEHILETTGNQRRAGGYISAACRSYIASGSIGFAQRVYRDYPSLCQPVPAADSILTDFLPRATEPQPHEQGSTESQDSSSSFGSELDAITRCWNPRALVRSSLLLMEEKDPITLLCKLLRLMCQNTRADYAAIAINDENDVETLRLRAAGLHDKIRPHDVSIKDDACRALCPTTYMVQVARTGRPMIVTSPDDHTRVDPFYVDLPKSFICLPIITQGLRAGVILLSSSFLAHADLGSTQDIIACLGTYGVIVNRLHSYIERLDLQAQELKEALEAKTSFLSHCSHELRTPLSAILGMTTVLEASSGLSVVQREGLNLIQSSGQDLLALIADILDQTRLDQQAVTLNPTSFALRDLLEEILHSIASVAQNKGIEISLLNDLSTDPPMVIADAFRVKQVILNLLSNAIKFTNKGKVTLEWSWEETAKGMTVSLNVKDTGIGIPQDQMYRLFGTFSQVDSSIRKAYGGSGLGLSIARSLSRLLGGDCTAQSIVGNGSTFTFSFRCGKGVAARIEPLAQPPKCLIIGNRPSKTLLADLQYLGCTVSVAQNEELVSCDVAFIQEDTNLAVVERISSTTKIFILARSIAIEEAISKFGLTRDSVISLPMKSHLLYQALAETTPISRLNEGKRPKMKPTRSERSIAKNYPLDILLVDDNHINIKVGKRLLGVLGYEKIDTVFDGQQALDQLDRKRYDVILLDLQMPVLDGYATHQQVIQRYGPPNAGGPCDIALSANADEETQRICRDLNFFAYLSKPVDIGKLSNILRDMYHYRQGNLASKFTV